MENIELNRKLENFLEEAKSKKVPKWENLPDIDLYMDQVVAFIDKNLEIFSGDKDKLITPSMINNYVKFGAIPAPIKKKYSREHLARIATICMLKPILPIATLATLTNWSSENQEPSQTFDRFIEQQISALKDTSSAVREDLAQIPNEEISAELASLALKLCAQANARRILAQKIISLLGENNASDKA